MTMSHYDPHDHPDLRSLDERITREFDDVLAAEQFAARISAQRRMTLRDRLVRAEDMAGEVIVETTAGAVAGTLAAVGSDHVVIGHAPAKVVAIAHIIGFQIDA